MELKNINSFQDFKKLNEERDFDHSFSNNTGFKESLVGRAVYSLFRYFKKGVDVFRLEYFKRQYENELFAGILRYLQENPELLDDISEFEKEQTSGEGQSQKEQIEKTEKTTTLVPVTCDANKRLKEIVGKTFSDLTDEKSKADVIEDLYDKLQKGEIVLSASGGQNTLKIINMILEKEDLPKETRDVLIALKRTIENKLKNNESYDDMIVEKIGSVINKNISIKQIYGDKLMNDKKFKDFNMNDVNWDKLVQKCKEDTNIKKDIAKLVNKEAIKEIQKGVSRIIYHTKATPSNKGVSPETGGGIMREQDTILRNRWEKVVNNTLSKFSGVMVINSAEEDEVVNPFKLINLEDAYKGSENNYHYKGMTTTQNKFSLEEFVEKTDMEKGKIESSTDKYGLLIVNNIYYIAYFYKKLNGYPVYIVYPLRTSDIKKDIEEKKLNTPIYKKYKTTQNNNIYGDIDIKNNYYIFVESIGKIIPYVIDKNCQKLENKTNHNKSISNEYVMRDTKMFIESSDIESDIKSLINKKQYEFDKKLKEVL